MPMREWKILFYNQKMVVIIICNFLDHRVFEFLKQKRKSHHFTLGYKPHSTRACESTLYL
jgi:hypothetical protein